MPTSLAARRAPHSPPACTSNFASCCCLQCLLVTSTKQKELLDAATCQCEEMERKVHEQEVQVRRRPLAG